MLSNGDRITGHIVSMDENSVIITTPYGELSINRKQVVKGTFLTIPDIPTDGLLFEFTFEDSFHDTSGNDITLTPIGEISFSTGVNQSLSVFSDGSGQYLRIDPAEELNNLDAFSVSLWANLLSNTRTHYLISKWDSTSGTKADGKFAISTKNHDLSCYIVDQEGNHHGLHAPDVMQSSQWNHIVVTFSQGILVVYVNNNQSVEAEFDFAPLFVDDAPIIIFTAKSNTEDTWSFYNVRGYLDNVRLYNRALTAEEVDILWNQMR